MHAYNITKQREYECYTLYSTYTIFEIFVLLISINYCSNNEISLHALFNVTQAIVMNIQATNHITQFMTWNLNERDVKTILSLLKHWDVIVLHGMELVGVCNKVFSLKKQLFKWCSTGSKIIIQVVELYNKFPC